MNDALPFIDLKKQGQVLAEPLKEAILGVVGRGQFIMGPEVGRLEKELAEYAGVKEVIACANGTDAILQPLMAWGLGPGDAVFTVPFTFMSTAEVVAQVRATPVFVDIEAATYNMDAAKLKTKIEEVKKEGKLTPKAIITVDLFGLPCDYEAIEKVAEEYGLLLLEDGAQAFGGVYHGKRCGSFGRAATTSFFPAKPLGCYGDGGAMFTNDEELAKVLRSQRVHGQGSHKYEHVRIGLNSRLDTMQAAILLVKLAAFPQELEARQKAARGYNQRLAGLGLTLPFIPEGCLSAWAQYTVRVPAERREAVMKAMSAEGVPTMIYYPQPLHLQPAYAYLGHKKGDFPVSEKASGEVMSLPMHPYLEDSHLDRVAQTLGRALA